MIKWTKDSKGFYVRTYIKDRPLKKDRVSSFKQLALARKHQCKELSEFICLSYELNYEYNENEIYV